MDYLFFIAIGISFILSYLFGRKMKSYWWMFVSPIIGIIVCIPTFLLFIKFGNIDRFGFGIVAVMPTVIVFTSFFNTVASLVGIFLGIFIKSKNNNHI